jgi:hypothetical protein
MEVKHKIKLKGDKEMVGGVEKHAGVYALATVDSDVNSA